MSVRLQLLYLVALSLVGGVFVASRRGRAAAGYAVLLGANLLLVLMLIGTGRVRGLQFWLAIGSFGLLVVVPWVLRAAQYRLLAADRSRAALAMARVREILQPGAGVAREREMLVAVALAREGRTQAAIDHLEAWAARGGRGRLLEAQEQIVAIFLMERRFADAIAYGEALGGAGERPLLLAGLVRAHVEVGDLVRAAEALRRLESWPGVSQTGAADLINQARLHFLAHAGEAEAVASLLASGSGFLPGLSEKSRAYWRGVACMRAGRVDSARAELLRAQAMAGPDEDRFRAAIRACIVAGPGEPASRDVSRFAREVGLRARMHRAVPRGGRLTRVAPITTGMAALCALAWVLVEVAGSSTDPWTLIAAGGHFRPAVAAGESWRLVSATFLHFGVLHLVVNVYALLSFGAVVERLYGPTRFFVLYVASGVVGFAASFLYGRAPMSVGASGCVFGMLGAAIAILLLRRGHLPEGWRRGTLASFAFMAAINAGIGFVVPMIDNAAHLGGLAAGLALGTLLVPGVMGSGDLVRAAVGALVLVAASAVGWAAVGVLTADSTRLLTRLPTRGERLGPVEIDAPDYWMRVVDGGEPALLDPAGAVAALAGDEDPREAERTIAAGISARTGDGDAAAFEIGCRRLAAGPTLCMRFPRSGRTSYLPLLDAMTRTARVVASPRP